MTARFDLVVRGGTVLDGTGGPAISGDVGILDGKVTAVGRFDGAGREEIDARDRLVTPGFVDIHTHYDGQITWEDTFAPSSTHGVTTVLMGNCGVGFAPCRPDDRDMLVKVMEGVEDIPEIVMTEGISWNWETFPQYLDALSARHADIDFATQVPHAPVRVYVMGERGARREPSTAQDMAAMARIVREGIEAGALGFTTSRTLFHRLVSGELIPTSTAAEDELRAIAKAMGAAGKGVIQLIDDFADCDDDGASEFAMLRRIVEESGRPLSFTVLDITSLGSRWRTLLREIERANRDGLPMRGQVAGRPASVLYGLDLSYHPFSTCPSYAAVAALPLDRKVAALRDPELRARLLAEDPVYANPRLLAFMRDVRVGISARLHATARAPARRARRGAGHQPAGAGLRPADPGRRSHDPLPAGRQLRRLLGCGDGRDAEPSADHRRAGRRRRALRHDLRRQLTHAYADLLVARPRGREVRAALARAPPGAIQRLPSDSAIAARCCPA